MCSGAPFPQLLLQLFARTEGSNFGILGRRTSIPFMLSIIIMIRKLFSDPVCTFQRFLRFCLLEEKTGLWIYISIILKFSCIRITTFKPRVYSNA